MKILEKWKTDRNSKRQYKRTIRGLKDIRAMNQYNAAYTREQMLNDRDYFISAVGYSGYNALLRALDKKLQ